MAIGCFLNCCERVQEFCCTYTPSPSLKPLTKDDILQEHHWQELGHLHDHLETFYEAIIMVEGNQTNIGDHFTTLDWLLLQL